VSLIVVILAIGMFAMAGLVIDGGIALNARGRATDLAQEAARAGAGALSPASLRGSRPDLKVDPGAATRAAQQVLDAGGAHGEVSVSGSEVTVTVHVAHRAAMLSAFGVTDLTGSGTATATVLHGTTVGRTG
jgi:Flp pilus assembly protein TadG